MTPFQGKLAGDGIRSLRGVKSSCCTPRALLGIAKTNCSSTHKGVQGHLFPREGLLEFLRKNCLTHWKYQRTQARDFGVALRLRIKVTTDTYIGVNVLTRYLENRRERGNAMKVFNRRGNRIRDRLTNSRATTGIRQAFWIKFVLRSSSGPKVTMLRHT